MSNKQTSVDWVVEQLEKIIEPGNQLVIGVILEQAKAMEKEQIKDAYHRGFIKMQKNITTKLINNKTNNNITNRRTNEKYNNEYREDENK